MINERSVESNNGNGEDVIILGRLGVEPNLKFSKSNLAICELSVGVSQEGSDKAIWKKVVTFGDKAKLASKNFRKGDSIFASGKKKITAYKSKEGVYKDSEEIVARHIGKSLM